MGSDGAPVGGETLYRMQRNRTSEYGSKEKALWLTHLGKQSLRLLTELEEMRHPGWSLVFSLRWSRGNSFRVVDRDHLPEILKQSST